MYTITAEVNYMGYTQFTPDEEGAKMAIAKLQRMGAKDICLNGEPVNE